MALSTLRISIDVLLNAEGYRIGEYDFDAATKTSVLLRQYIWLGDKPVAVVENEVDYFVRLDHIRCPAGHCPQCPRGGRPVFATDSSGNVVRSSTGAPPVRG